MAAAAGSAQSAKTVDFSGRWLPIPGASKPVDLRLGPGFIVAHDSATFTITYATTAAKPQTYRFDGSKTTRVETSRSNGQQTFTSTAAWNGSTLVITTEEGFSRTEMSYAIDVADSGNLVVTSSTILLYKNGGKLTVDTIGPFVRVYKKS